jgi:hypothetical protein
MPPQNPENEPQNKQPSFVYGEDSEIPFMLNIGGKSYRVTDSMREKIKEWLKYLDEDHNAKEVFRILNPKQRRHMIELLVKIVTKNGDPKTHNLYGAIDTLLKAGTNLLQIPSLKVLYEKANQIEKEKEKKRKALKYAKDFCSYLVEHNHVKDISEQLKTDIELVLLKSFDNLNKRIREVLNGHNITLSENVHINVTFLYGLAPEEPTTKIGEFIVGSTTYTIMTLNNSEEMQKESATLKHCVGTTARDYYAEKVMKNKIKVISLRVNDVPKWTIEYNLKDKKIYQFKGGGDEPINSLPESRELLTSTLQSLYENGYEVDGITEEFEYAIWRDNKEKKYKTGENSNTRELCKDGNIKILKGKIEVDESFDEEEVLKLTQIEGLTLDLTNCPKEIKDSIVSVKGNLIDISTSVSYKSLTSIGGDAHFYNLTDSEGLNSLKSIGGNAGFDNLTNAEGLNALTSIGGYAYFDRLTNAKGLNSLNGIGGDANFGNLTDSEDLNSLTSIGGDAYFENLTNAADLNSLTSIGGDAYFYNLTNAEGLKVLIEKDLHISYKLDVNTLEKELSVKGIIKYLANETDFKNNNYKIFANLEGFLEYKKTETVNAASEV